MFNTTKYNFVSICEKLENEIQGYTQDDSHLYDEWCRDIKSQYEKYIDHNKKHTCQQVMYILYIISTQHTLYNDGRCRYLYYWIYHALLHENKNYDMALQLYRIFLKTYFDAVTDDHICMNYVDDSKNIILEKSAKLTELYDTINNNKKAFDCACARKCYDLYIKYVEECHNDYDYDYCSELQSFKHKYGNNMKSIETCDGAGKILPSAIKHDLHVIIIIPMIILTIFSFLVFVLYKFTPIGSRITRRKRRQNVFLENQFDRTNTLLPTSGRTRRTEQNIAYNIAYDSTTYS